MNNNYMEIERKFLTVSLPFDLTQFPLCKITQIYISLKPTIRIRKYNEDYVLTVKGDGGLAKQEFELPITFEEFSHLATKAETNPMSKTRYLVPLENGLTAEVDVYDGICKGLITTEVEFNSVEEANSFNPPLWFGKEVTFDHRYKNTSLSKYGIPDKEG